MTTARPLEWGQRYTLRTKISTECRERKRDAIISGSDSFDTEPYVRRADLISDNPSELF